MATQHPDNAQGPYWRDNKSPYIDTHDEVAECFHSFADLDCDEYMWDWEGKFVDEAVIDRLYYRHSDYFKKNALGKDKFLTFRIPNTMTEKGIRLARAFMGIITAAQAAKDLGVYSPPLFEVILPMTTSAQQLIKVVKKFNNLIGYEKKIFDDVSFGKNKLEMIPLIEGSVSLLKSQPLLIEYAKEFKNVYGEAPQYIRPFIARSDPALDAGFVPASLAARAAISEYYTFESKTKIKVYPIMGAGSLNFRGGLAPNNIDNFITNYAGVRTVTIQSAFRYDHDISVVKSAIKKLKKSLAAQNARIFNENEMQTILEFSQMFAKHYRGTIELLAQEISDFSKFIPRHRERINHSGHFGYSRKVGHSNVALPRAIAFTGVFFSLGIPPTLVGTGRGVRKLIQTGQIKSLESFLPCFHSELKNDFKYLNEENLMFLAKTNLGWKQIQDDIQILKNYLGYDPEKHMSESDYVYRNTTSNVFHYWKNSKFNSLKESILEAAKLRKSLG